MAFDRSRDDWLMEQRSSPIDVFWVLSIGLAVIILAGRFDIDRLTDGKIISPVDEFLLVGLVWFVLCVGSFYRIALKSRIETAFLVIVPFFFWACMSGLRGNLNDGVVGAASDLSLVFLLCAATAVLCRVDARRFALLYLKFAMYAGIVFSVVGVLTLDSERMSAFGGGPNVFARITGFGAIAGLYLVFSRRISPLFLVAIPIMMIATVLSGSRGAMVGFLVALVFLVPILRRVTLDGRFIRFALLGLVAAVMAGRPMWNQLSAMVETRILQMTFEEGYTSGRNELANLAMTMFLERPLLGWGLHSFETLWSESTGFSYPHNLVLQVAAELGAVGVVLLLLIMVKWLTFRPFYHGSPLICVLNSGVALYLTVSMFSGDYYDARQFFVLAIVSISLRSAGRVDGLKRAEVGGSRTRQAFRYSQRPQQGAAR